MTWQETVDLIETERRLRSAASTARTADLTLLADSLLRSADKLLQPMQLAIIGKISSSKSTLVNAILQKDELMTTGQKEVTYNVGWLKYGNPDSPVTVHYKDGSIVSHPRDWFATVESDKGEGSNELDRIQYIEVTDDVEILKEINIIDTPGLDALRGKDSQNTLDFISKVRPDAVIMLFTHSIAESVLDVVRQFNAESSFNPLNAIGVLAKIDVLWQESMPRPKTAMPIAMRSVKKQLERDPGLRKTLYGLYPVSALLYMASSTLTEDDVVALREGIGEDSAAWRKALRSPKAFVESELALPQDRRRALLARMGLYGICLATEELIKDGSTTADDIKNVFRKESGAQDFIGVLMSHFAKRSRLIKLESAYQEIMQSLKKTRALDLTPPQQMMLKNVESDVSEMFAGLRHEHEKLELLNEAYAGNLDFDDDEVVEEIIRVCGEHGSSAPQLLGLPQGTPYDVLMETALDREKFWRKEIAMEPDPGLRQRMNVLLKTYSSIRMNLREMKHNYDMARAFIFNETVE